jgi:hypothetical protein
VSLNSEHGGEVGVCVGQWMSVCMSYFSEATVNCIGAQYILTNIDI